MATRSWLSKRHLGSGMAIIHVSVILAILGLLLGCTTGQPPAPTSAPTSISKPTAAPAATPPSAPSPTAAPKASPAAAAPKTLTTLKVGHFSSEATAGLYVAYEKGYFEQLGMKLELTEFASLVDSVPLLATGELALNAGGIGAGTYNAIGRGIPLKLVACKGTEKTGYNYKALVVRKDLYDKGEFKDLKQAKGKKIASLPRGVSMDFQLDKVLETVGLKFADIEYKEMAVPDTLPALKSGAIDAAWILEPMVTAAKAQGLGVPIVTYDTIDPGYQAGAITYSAKFIEREPQLAKDFMVAYIKGVRDYTDAFLKGKNKDEVIKILTKYTPVKDPKLFEAMGWLPVNPNGYLNTKSMIEEQQWYLSQGLIKQIIPMEKVVDNSYVDYAIKQLGEYK